MYALLSVSRPTGRVDATLHVLYEGRTQFLMYTEQMNSWGGGGEEAVVRRRCMEGVRPGNSAIVGSSDRTLEKMVARKDVFEGRDSKEGGGKPLVHVCV